MAHDWNLCGNDRAYRAGFADFLRSTFLGQGATTHFEKSLGVKVEELEPEWIAYVKEIAGG